MPAVVRLIMPRESVTKQELARLVGVSLSTINRDIATGKLKVWRRGSRCVRIFHANVVEWIQHVDPSVEVVIECRQF